MSQTIGVFVETLVPVFFVLALGYYSGKRGRIDNCNTSALNTALMHFALPCSLFLAVGRTPSALLKTQSPLLAALAVAMLLTYGITYFMSRRLFKASAGEAAVQSLTVSFSNNVAIGLPLLMGVYGATGLLAGAAGILSGALVISPITLVLLECYATPASNAPLLKRLPAALFASLRRPVVLAPLLALLLPLTGHTLPEAAVHSLDLIGKATVGLALFLTGLILSAQPFRLSASVAAGVLLKNFAQPALLVALIFVFRLHGEIAREAFLLAAVPAGFFGTVFGARYRVASIEASSTLVLSTLLSVLTLPLAIALSIHLP